MNQPQFQGGVGIVSNTPQTIQPGQYVPGARGMTPGHGGAAPAGAAQFGDFLANSEGGRKATVAPMERPVMQKHVQKCRVWFNNFLLRARGTPLEDNEQVPRLLLLTMALFHTEARDRHDVLNCMKNITIPIAVSDERGVTVTWERQPFKAVPWEARQFPIAVAISIIEQVRTTVFDDLNWLWDQQANKKVHRRLDTSEKPRVGPAPFRAPTEAEIASRAEEYGVTLQTPIQMGSDLLMDFGGGAVASSAPAAQPNAQPGIGSAPLNTEPEGAALAQGAGPGGAAPVPAAPGGFAQPQAAPGGMSSPPPTPGGMPPAGG